MGEASAFGGVGFWRSEAAVLKQIETTKAKSEATTHALSNPNLFLMDILMPK